MSEMAKLGTSVKDFVSEKSDAVSDDGIHTNFRKMIETVEALEQRVERLVEKLTPVLAPEGPSTSDTTAQDRKSQSSLAHDLDNVSDRVSRCRIELDNLLTRCEL